MYYTLCTIYIVEYRYTLYTIEHPSLQVETSLENPTPFHLKETQRRQIQEYMNSGNGDHTSKLSPNSTF